MIARTYIDSMRNGVYRVFWYGWDSHILGIDTIDPNTKQITSAGTAFLTVQDWMVGKRWLGCKDKKSIRSCKLQGLDGARSTIVYATSKTRTLTIPNGVGAYQVLSGAVIPVAPGQKVKVNGNPIMLLGRLIRGLAARCGLTVGSPASQNRQGVGAPAPATPVRGPDSSRPGSSGCCGEDQSQRAVRVEQVDPALITRDTECRSQACRSAGEVPV